MNLCKTCIHAVFEGNKPTYCNAMVKDMNCNSCQLYEAIITEEEFLKMLMTIREGLIE